MIPLKNMMARRSVPVVTIVLIIVNVLVFCYQISLSHAANDALIRTFGLVPLKMKLALAGSHYTLVEAFLPLVTCMFLHGGFLHILGNMWFLWIFGGAVEDRLGPIQYFAFLFYLWNRFRGWRRPYSAGDQVCRQLEPAARSPEFSARMWSSSLVENLDPRSALRFFLYRADSGHHFHRTLVRYPIPQRSERAEYPRRSEFGRSGLVGPCRRLCAGSCLGEGF